MRLRRGMRRFLIFLLVAVVAAAVVVYVMVCRRPAGYDPVHLSVEEQDRWARLFSNHIVNDFYSKAGAGRPFAWTLTAQQANHYLAAIDGIATLRSFEAGKRVYAMARMEKAGLVAPAVAMGDGLLTLMVHQKRHDKIISVDIGFAFEDEFMTARLRGVRVGTMPIPLMLLEGRLAEVRAKLSDQLVQAERAGDPGPGSLRVTRLAKLLRQVLRMLDGQWIRPEIEVDRHRVLVESIDIEEGKLAIRFTPVLRTRKDASDSP